MVNCIVQRHKGVHLFVEVTNYPDPNAFHIFTVAQPGKFMEKVNISEKLRQFTDYWNPRIIGELNGQHVKAVKFQGPFVWHHHDHEDELFLVIKGRLTMEFTDKIVQVDEGEFIIVPRGIEHRPVADQEVHVLLFEPASTVNTGNIENEKTRNKLEKI